jgi:FkbM family methyltransferase
MLKLLSIFFLKVILIIDQTIYLFTKKNIKHFMYENLRENCYSVKKINNQTISFFTPSHISKFRFDTLLTKEIETIDWINNFKINKNEIFWDIGANVGTYSIYAASKFPSLKVVAFEPSFLNLNLLSRNININNLSKNILVNQLPLSNKENNYEYFKETSLIEGAAINSFDNSDTDHSNSNNNFISKTYIYGTSPNFFVKNKILDIPTYIKIDVDGLEFEVLQGMSSFLSDERLKEILIELEETNGNSEIREEKLLYENGFLLDKKLRSYESKNDLIKTYNYIFKRNI